LKKSVVEEKRFVTLPMVLGQAGYHTALYGKSHLGTPTIFGFAEGREVKAANDEETFAKAAKFLERESKSERPFLLWLTPHNPHALLHRAAALQGSLQRQRHHARSELNGVAADAEFLRSSGSWCHRLPGWPPFDS
jgi:arylsulfatase A-like enzyme